MQILTGILSFLLILTAMLGLFWTFCGIPLVIVLAKLRSKNKVLISNKQLWLLATGGLIALALSLVCFFIMSVALGFFGRTGSTLTLPRIEPSGIPQEQQAL